ncbi:MAG: sulfatase-like hydrolase/transferase [Bacteroidetes bacterium]|nr:sulfatase-like hydrolase/transferase [Bacteroidota bacterium]
MHPIISRFRTFFQLAIIRQLLFALALLSLSRLVWLLLNTKGMGQTEPVDVLFAIAWGVYFDLPVIAYVFSPLWLWMVIYPTGHIRFPRISRLLFTIPAALCLTLNAIDSAYSRVTGRRSGPELFTNLADEGNHILPYITEYWYAITALLLIIVCIYHRVPLKKLSLYIYGKPWYAPLWIIPLYTAVWILAARGGLQLKPLRSLDAGLYVSPGLTNLTTSTPLQILSGWGHAKLAPVQLMNQDSAEKLILPLKKGHQAATPQKNIVLLIVESLGRDYTGFMNGRPYTPFLDSLSRQSLVFQYCYANGTRSIEMVPSIFCGIPGFMEEHYITSVYSTNKVENAFASFRKTGYSTQFFHGAANGTMGFASFLGHTGGVQYFGLNEYPAQLKEKDYDGAWGIYDEPWLQYVIHCLDTVKKPFFSAAFTLSSHHPYQIPDRFKKQFPEGPLPIHRSIRYADYALQSFFKEAATKPWFKNTLFVITGDHTSYGLDDYFYSPIGHFEIPLLIYGSSVKPGSVDKTVSQCDIIPTLAEMTGLTAPVFSMGRSAFDSTYPGYSFHFESGLYYMVQYPLAMAMDEQGRVKDFHRQVRNEKVRQPLARHGTEYVKMEKILRAAIQVFHTRLNENTWNTNTGNPD